MMTMTMTMTTAGRQGSSRRSKVGLVMLATLLSACAARRETVSPVPVTVAPPPLSASAIVATPNLPPEARFTLVLDLLGQGKAAQARADLMRYLDDRPRDARARDLLRQVDTDPRTLYGGASFPYTITRDDTLASIAQRLMGSRYRFYGLARYNDLAVPAEAKAGQVIRVPERAKPVAPVRAMPAAQARDAVVTQRPAADPATAEKLRRDGLEQLVAGAPDRAAALLERAATLDPGSPGIGRDLARARRIQATVRARR